MTDAVVSDFWIDVADPELPQIEVARIRDFVEANPSLKLTPRPDEQFAQSVTSGLAFRIQRAPDIGGGIENLCGQATVFDRRGGLVHEVGAVLVAPSFRGLTFQKVLMRVAVAHVVEQAVNLTEEPDWLVFAVVADDNVASIASIEQSFFTLAPDDDTVWSEIEREPAALRAAGKRVYVLRADKIPDLRACLQEFAAKPVIERGPRIAEIHFCRRLARYGDAAFYQM